jgi:hypothetical protein
MVHTQTFSPTSESHSHGKPHVAQVVVNSHSLNKNKDIQSLIQIISVD